MFWFGECCAVPAQVGLVMTRHSPLFCCVCVARVPGLCPGILFMSCWYLWLPRVVWHAPRHPKCMAPCGGCTACCQSVCQWCPVKSLAGLQRPHLFMFYVEGRPGLVPPHHVLQALREWPLQCYQFLGGSPRLRVQGNPGLFTQLQLCTAAHPPC